VTSARVPIGGTCAGDCLLGFVKAGGLLFGCYGVEGEAGMEDWMEIQQNLTCAGRAA
jgi:hypothetical protein